MPSSRPHRNFVTSFFETVKCTLKIRIYHYDNDKSCADFSLKMHQKRLVGGLRPDSLGELPQTSQLDLRAEAGTREVRRGKAGGDSQLRKGAEEGGKGRERRRDGREWEENGSRNLAGASKGTPGDAKFVTEILGGGAKIRKWGQSPNLVS